MHAGEQAPQRAVIGLVQPLDAPDRLVDRDALAVDFLGVADDARDRASPPATRIERVLAKEGRRPSNMRGSSS